MIEIFAPGNERAPSPPPRQASKRSDRIVVLDGTDPTVRLARLFALRCGRTIADSIDLGGVLLAGMYRTIRVPRF